MWQKLAVIPENNDNLVTSSHVSGNIQYFPFLVEYLPEISLELVHEEYITKFCDNYSIARDSPSVEFIGDYYRLVQS